MVPPSPNSGLISWVAQCDTLHALIKEYREQRRTLLNIEHRLILQMAPDYDMLPVLQKLQVFDYALENTGGQDLAKGLWLGARNAAHAARSRPSSGDHSRRPSGVVAGRRVMPSVSRPRRQARRRWAPALRAVSPGRKSVW